VTRKETNMIAIEELAYVRYQAPDLDRMETFLVDFGFATAKRTPDSLYIRCAGDRPFVHVTNKGEPAGGIGLGFVAGSRDDLHRLAAEIGGKVESTNEPGGGQAVRVVDPSGYKVEVLWGWQPVATLPVRLPVPSNVHGARSRLGELVRLSPGPSHVMRLGHVVLRVASYKQSFDFYTRLFGLKVADSYFVGDEQHTVAAFLRAGLGARYTDHHTVALVESPKSGFDHSSFEVIDWDDVALGHRHLQAKGRKLSWGVGRHIHGSQIFDYWRDPFGSKLEHYTDGDLINEDYRSSVAPLSPDVLAQWAPPMPADFFD